MNIYYPSSHAILHINELHTNISIIHYSLSECFIRTMESAEAMIVFNKYDELMELVKKYVSHFILIVHLNTCNHVVLRIRLTLNGLKELM